MKIFQALILLIGIGMMLCITCCQSKSNELIEFYESQNRDSRLFGLWKSTDQYECHELFEEMKSDGKITIYTIDHVLNDTFTNTYLRWYTVNDSILYELVCDGWKGTTKVPPIIYKIKEDSLYIKSMGCTYRETPSYIRVKSIKTQ